MPDHPSRNQPKKELEDSLEEYLPALTLDTSLDAEIAIQEQYLETLPPIESISRGGTNDRRRPRHRQAQRSPTIQVPDSPALALSAPPSLTRAHSGTGLLPQNPALKLIGSDSISAPVTPGSSAPPDQDERSPWQCHKKLGNGRGCRNKILKITRTEDVNAVGYCHGHISAKDIENIVEERIKGSDYSEYIPKYLSALTQAEILDEMDKQYMPGNEDGFIYGFRVVNDESCIKIKVGRTAKLENRMEAWRGKCGKDEFVFLACWTGDHENPWHDVENEVQRRRKASLCRRHERLVHLELMDLVVHKQYLDKGFKTGISTKPSTVSLASEHFTPHSCSSCKTAHKEVLTFARAPDSSFVGKEWEEIVMPIIERYGKFIRKYVQDMSATGTGALSTPITSLT